MSTELALADILALNPAIMGGLDADTLAVAGGIGGNTKSISIKGGVFRKYAGGKEIGTIVDRHMNIIIVKMAHKASRMMYDKAFVEGDNSGSPVCWSTDSNTPDESVETPQAATCSACPHSIKGSGNNGTGTKCSLFWKTAVVIPNDPAGDVMELRLAATSVFGEEKNGMRPFRAYIQHLASHNVSAGRIVTKMQFDIDSTHPKVMFSPVSAVPESDLHIIAEQALSKAAEHAITINVYKPVATPEVEFLQKLKTAPVVEVQSFVEAPAVDTQTFVEPVVKKPAAPAAKPAADMADVVKKWSGV